MSSRLGRMGVGVVSVISFAVCQSFAADPGVFFGAVAAQDAHAASVVVAGASDCDGDGTIEGDDCNANGRQDECDLNEPVSQSYSFSPTFRIDIPDFAEYGFGVSVPLQAVVLDVDVALYIEHPFQHDLVVTLSHGGVTQTLILRAGSSCGAVYSADNFGASGGPLVLDDAASVAVDCYDGNTSLGVNGFAGPAQPTTPLAAFNGLAAGGLWTLSVSDQAQGNLGGLWSWRLDLRTVAADCNDNEIPDECEPDCNNNDVSDDCDIRDGTSTDCNADGIPDSCQIDGNDCNYNGTPDGCELVDNDCNHNGRPDDCDLYGPPGNVAGGIRGNDCNNNNIPDDCELGENDCNANGYPDDCDIRGGGRLLYADFENGLPDGWSLEGQFSVTDVCRAETVCDGDFWAYAGQTESCSTTSEFSAVLVSPAFRTDFPLSTLRFCSRLGESSSGWARIRYDCQYSGGSQVPEWITDQAWHDYEVDLSWQLAARGSCVLYFEFATDDSTLGWQIDAIELVSGSADGNENGVPDECEADCNNNQVPDADDIAQGTSFDCNANLTPDECERENDCNQNQRPDECDLEVGSSEDCNRNGRPDECETLTDCNQNQRQDSCDIDLGTSRDCNQNQQPDECEITNNPYLDCNTNGELDPCEVEAGLESDCNGNNFLDRCDIQFGLSEDCNENGVPDTCDLAPTTAAELCRDARPICPGQNYSGSTFEAGNDGSSDCGASESSADVWYRYIPASSGAATISLCGSGYDTVLSAHRACPGGVENQIVCNDDSCDFQSVVQFDVEAEQPYWIRVAGYGGDTGLFHLTLEGPACGGVELDCNENEQPDSCELDDNDVNANSIPDDCEKFPPGDFTGDGVVTLDDLPYFDDCLAGPGETLSPECETSADFDADGDVDLHDYSGFSVVIIMK